LESIVAVTSEEPFQPALVARVARFALVWSEEIVKRNGAEGPPATNIN
jgi:hypothetical protein